VRGGSYWQEKVTKEETLRGRVLQRGIVLSRLRCGEDVIAQRTKDGNTLAKHSKKRRTIKSIE